jgi:hypothetical protein
MLTHTRLRGFVILAIGTVLGYGASISRYFATPTWSLRIRRTSAAASGVSFAKWSCWIMISDAAPSRCALSYEAIPSVQPSGGVDEMMVATIE